MTPLPHLPITDDPQPRGLVRRLLRLPARTVRVLHLAPLPPPRAVEPSKPSREGRDA